MQECWFEITLTVSNPEEKVSVEALLDAFEDEDGFGRSGRRWTDSLGRFNFQTSDVRGAYMLEADPRVETLVEKLKSELSAVDFEAEFRIEYTGGEDLPPWRCKYTSTRKGAFARNDAVAAAKTSNNENCESHEGRKEDSNEAHLPFLLGLREDCVSHFNELVGSVFANGPIRIMPQGRKNNKADDLAVGDMVLLEVVTDSSPLSIDASWQELRASLSVEVRAHLKYLIGRIDLDDDQLKVVALTVNDCVAFVAALDPLEIYIDRIPDAQALDGESLAYNSALARGDDRYRSPMSSSMRYSTQSQYLRKYPERKEAFGVPARQRKLATPDEEKIKTDWGFSRTSVPKKKGNLVFYKGVDECAIVPSVIGKREVTGLADQAFGGYAWDDGFPLGNDKNRHARAETLRTVICPDCLKTIGSWAFAGSGVKKLEIPATVTSIDDEAFFYSRIEKIVARGTEKQFEKLKAKIEKALRQIPDCKLTLEKAGK